MAKFATPVAMKVTKEQGKYLLDKLISMGYKEIHRDTRGYITTNWNGSNHDVTIAAHRPSFRHIIEEYNPDLFLAIAAMTEDKIPIIGEWLKYKESNKIFRVEYYGNCNNYVFGGIDKGNPNGSGYFLKVTLEELINHFSKPEETFILPELWRLEVTEENVDAVNKWKSSIGTCFTLRPGHAVDHDGYWGSTINGMIAKNTIITTEQFMEYVYKPTFNKIPDEFYIHYCEGFTEDIFNALFDWAKVHSSGKIRGHNDTYGNFSKKNDRFWRFNFLKDPIRVHSDLGFGYGVDNHNWSGGVKTEYSLEQVKKLINYKPKTNKNEYKENSYESREIKQIDEDLDSISSREGGKEIKIRTVSSRNLCERGSIESSNSITSPRGSSGRLRAERGKLHI